VFAFSILFSDIGYAQRTIQEIKASKQKTGVFIEIKQTQRNMDFQLPQGKAKATIEWTNGPTVEHRYWMGPNAANILTTALKKVLSWADLNQTHHKEFEKEATRIWVMDKESFLFHGYVPQLTDEVILLFRGKSDGSFSCILSFRSDAFDVHFENKQEVNDFVSLISGKPVNKEIDDIFK
jgi:hypothetical protein